MFGRKKTRDDAAIRTTWLLASRLVNYPDDELIADIPELRQAAADAVGRDKLDWLMDELTSRDLVELQQEYVATFDLRRRASLFLTYYSHGDTRKRGMALLEAKQLYAAHGLELLDGELPDHLAVVLAFGGHGDFDAAHELLLKYRPGLELLRLSLSEKSSPWLAAVEAVCETLPQIRGEDDEIVRRLLAAGPPDEGVGLDPYSLGMAPDRPSAGFGANGVPAAAGGDMGNPNKVFIELDGMMPRSRKG